MELEVEGGVPVVLYDFALGADFTISLIDGYFPNTDPLVSMSGFRLQKGYDGFFMRKRRRYTNSLGCWGCFEFSSCLHLHVSLCLCGNGTGYNM